MRLPVSATIIAAGLLLSACSSIGALTGAVTGAAAGGGSANPAVGYAVGIGSKAATDALVKYLSKKRQAKEQDLIAAQTGTMAVGSTAAWSIHHKIPLFDDEHGHVTVVRVVQNALTDCKEVFFHSRTRESQSRGWAIHNVDLPLKRRLAVGSSRAVNQAVGLPAVGLAPKR